MVNPQTVGYEIGKTIASMKKGAKVVPIAVSKEPALAPQDNTPVISVSFPEIVVNIPELPKPIVTVTAAPPVINVETTPSAVNVAAPTVNVAAPSVSVAPAAVNFDTKQISDAIRSLADAIKGSRQEMVVISGEIRGQRDAISALADAMLAPRSLVMENGKPVGVKIDKKK
jgi:hypothetical protein